MTEIWLELEQLTQLAVSHPKAEETAKKQQNRLTWVATPAFEGKKG